MEEGTQKSRMDALRNRFEAQPLMLPKPVAGGNKVNQPAAEKPSLRPKPPKPGNKPIVKPKLPIQKNTAPGVSPNKPKLQISKKPQQTLKPTPGKVQFESSQKENVPEKFPKPSNYVTGVKSHNVALKSEGVARNGPSDNRNISKVVDKGNISQNKGGIVPPERTRPDIGGHQKNMVQKPEPEIVQEFQGRKLPAEVVLASGKRLRLLPKPTGEGEPPKPPARPPFVDPAIFQSRIHKETNKDVRPIDENLVARQPNNNNDDAAAADDSDEEMYDDIENVMGERQPNPVSLISEYDSELEEEDEENYDDIVNVEGEPSEGEDEDIYEAFDELIPQIQEPRDKLKEVETMEKKENDLKKQKKKEKEELEMRTKFQLDGTEIVINTGMMCAATKGGKYDLMLKKGENIDIIRVDKNPAGKWLVRNQSGTVGYVKSSNVEIPVSHLSALKLLDTVDAYQDPRN